MEYSSQQVRSLVTVLIALVFVVGIFFAGVRYGTLVAGEKGSGGSGQQILPGSDDIFSIRDTDVPRGNGPVLLIEYSDFECPFCQQFHPTVQALVDQGSVTWVYRHLPLDFHPTAFDAAVLSACVNRHLGGERFWQYTDEVFASGVAPSLEKYRAIASSLGLSSSQSAACLAEGSPERALVQQHVSEAGLLGINGTPGSLLIDQSTGTLIGRIPGALPLESVQQLVQSAQ